MTNDSRIFKRVEFEADDAIFGDFILPSQEPILWTIVNLGAGGFNLAIPQEDAVKVKAEDVVQLKRIIGTENLEFLGSAEADIKWLKEQSELELVLAGCEFRNLSEPVIQQIIKFVDSERMVRGQYD
jgi:c-di-GMP-binding flagellar brake protein YcgR